jgi:hypothetical protein
VLGAKPQIKKEFDMTANEYADRVVNECQRLFSHENVNFQSDVDFMRRITDHVFLTIESNPKLLREYEKQINAHSRINAVIGKKVKEIFQLGDGGVCDKPKSELIQTFTLHKR